MEFISVQLFEAKGIYSGWMKIFFNDKIQYKFEWCMNAITDFPTDLPTDNNKVWRITKSSDPAVIIIHCNDIEVLNFLFASQCPAANWEAFWKKDVNKIWFYQDNTDFYRAVPRPGKY